MKQLAKTVRLEVSFKDRVTELAQPILNRVAGSNESIKKAVNEVESNSDIQGAIGALIFFTIVGGIATLILAVTWSCWVFFSFAIALGLGFLAYYLNRRENRRVSREKGDIRARMEHDRSTDPFYQRAKLIADAVANFVAHCDRYDAEFDLVKRGLKEEDSELMDRYYTQLERSEAVIELAIRNYLNATERRSRLAAFAKDHPAINSKPESTSLAQLVTLLDEPMEIPELSGIPQTREVLDYEDELRKVSMELSGHASDATFDKRLSDWQTSQEGMQAQADSIVRAEETEASVGIDGESATPSNAQAVA